MTKREQHARTATVMLAKAFDAMEAVNTEGAWFEEEHLWRVETLIHRSLLLYCDSPEDAQSALEAWMDGENMAEMLGVDEEVIQAVDEGTA